ncbi:hypothetical protein V6N11_063302 [Hibiscus sabdariffa]|uniref:Uncharacterized protein n=1 Tax=Hibiscus sabdariffa TaxID=183260 RepID=A0ABR2NGN5_9ROSI
MGDNQFSAENEGYEPWLKASSTWVKHEEANRKKEAGFNKKQIKVVSPVNKTVGEGSKDGVNELQVWNDSLKTLESTRQTVQDNACQIRETLQGSDTILGLSMDPGYQGIISDWPLKLQSVCQNKTKALCLYGGFFLWNRSLINNNQTSKHPKNNKGKKAVESSEGEGKNKMEDLVSDYLHGHGYIKQQEKETR